MADEPEVEAEIETEDAPKAGAVRLAHNIVKVTGGKRVTYAAGAVVPRSLVADLLKADPRLDADHGDHARQAAKDADLAAQHRVAAGKTAQATASIAAEVGKGKRRKG